MITYTQAFMIYKEINGSNYVWFHNETNNIKITFGLSNNTKFEEVFIKKSQIYWVLNDNLFTNKFNKYFVNTDLTNDLKKEIYGNHVIKKLKLDNI